MEFSHTFFEDEVREGFYISGSMKRVWAAQLEVLEEIDKVCKRHDIKWFAHCGTLLGAVRHGGYIPWDDDLDICMLREDYERFLAVAGGELPSGYEVKDGSKEEDYQFWSWVTNSPSVSFDGEFLKKHHACPYKVIVDIYPLDYVIPDTAEEEKRREAANLCFTTAYAYTSELEGTEMLEDILRKLEALCNVRFDRTRPMRRQLHELVRAMYAQRSREHASEVVELYWWVKEHDHKYPLSCFEGTAMLPFENVKLPVPVGYDKVLRIEYGDYMKIIKDFGMHGYPNFAEQEEQLIRLVPSYPFRYQFDEGDMRDVERLPKRQSRLVASAFADTLSRIEGIVSDMLRAGRYDACAALLETCQESAIRVGTMIEQDYTEPLPVVPLSDEAPRLRDGAEQTVKLLEDYCELLYEIHELMAQGEVNAQNAEVIVQSLAEMFDVLKQSIHRNITERKEIVFLPFRAVHWSALEYVWRAACEDAHADVYVIPIPYYEKDAYGGLTEMHYEGEQFPDYVQVIDYRTYDFAGRHPDVIYIQNPYDECNYTMSVDPDFFARNLKQYTEELIYVPYFTTDEIQANQEKALYTMRYFCRVPGVVLADRVLVQSENMRERYIDCLTEMAGEETRRVWEQRIEELRAWKDDASDAHGEWMREQILQEVPQSWKDVIYRADGSRKRIVLFVMGAASFAQYGKRMIEKLAEVLDTFEGYRGDIALLWQQQSDIMEVPDREPQLRDMYRELTERYKSQNYGIWVDGGDVRQAVAMCDAYYGEAGYVARLCQMQGKPVMVMDVEVGLSDGDICEIKMQCSDFVKKDGVVFFSAMNMNAVCSLNPNSGELEFLGRLPEASFDTNELPYVIKAYKDKLYLSPYQTSKLWCYDIRKQSWKSMELRTETPKGGHRVFKQMVQYEDKLFLFSGLQSYLAYVDLNTDEIMYLNGVFSEQTEALCEDVDRLVGRSYVQKGRYLWLASWVMNCVLKLDMKTLEYEWLKVGAEENRYAGIAWNGNRFWLAPRGQSTIIIWDGGTETEEFALPKQDDYNFSEIISYRNQIIVSNWYHALMIDVDTKSIRVIEGPELGKFTQVDDFVMGEKGGRLVIIDGAGQIREFAFVVRTDGLSGCIAQSRYTLTQWFSGASMPERTWFSCDHLCQIVVLDKEVHKEK